jgi:hypothetical protein
VVPLREGAISPSESTAPGTSRFPITTGILRRVSHHRWRRIHISKGDDSGDRRGKQLERPPLAQAHERLHGEPDQADHCADADRAGELVGVGGFTVVVLFAQAYALTANAPAPAPSAQSAASCADSLNHNAHQGLA